MALIGYGSLRRIRVLTQRVDKMEERMSAFDDELAQMRTDLTTVADEVTAIRVQIANGDQSAAERLRPLADQLHSMAAVTPPVAPSA